ncbi:hypothetical protein HD553DRAFT_302911 [Filobasidium floriforme]|uniref:uncharacterized protein n=1 Tax=Filobasidium floriforme TaxID=5210 RepID=UPI001E8D59ED|nr:uncharacterized protein HD553DRAFT_302911 [Filobasidium floriforme]KAH8090625.1 hypothetical protein HD553DRAFT_302911 [Filobasidium floriforme]
MAETADRLEPFLLMARSTKGAAAAKIVQTATAAPGVYGFGELLDVPNIKQLQESPEHSSSYKLLELFAYGNLADYKANQSGFPALNESHINKLKHLTLVSLCLDSRTLPYDHLLRTLEIASVRDLEDLIIDAMYSNVLGGKLNQERGTLSVDWVIGRDISRVGGGMEEVQRKLAAWCDNAQGILNSIDRQIANAKAESSRNRQVNAEYLDVRDKAYNTKLASLQDRQQDRVGGGTSSFVTTNRTQWGSGFNPSFAQPPRASEFETMTDMGDDPGSQKGRKAVQEEVPMKRQKNTQTPTWNES